MLCHLQLDLILSALPLHITVNATNSNKLEFICRKEKPLSVRLVSLLIMVTRTLDYLYLHTLYTRQCRFDAFLHIHIYNSCRLFTHPNFKFAFSMFSVSFYSYCCCLLLCCSIIIIIIAAATTLTTTTTTTTTIIIIIIITSIIAVLIEISDCASVNFCLVDLVGRMVNYSADMHIHKQLQYSGSRYSI